jgi:hypothetical protein
LDELLAGELFPTKFFFGKKFGNHASGNTKQQCKVEIQVESKAAFKFVEILFKMQVK